MYLYLYTLIKLRLLTFENTYIAINLDPILFIKNRISTSHKKIFFHSFMNIFCSNFLYIQHYEDANILRYKSDLMGPYIDGHIRSLACFLFLRHLFCLKLPWFSTSWRSTFLMNSKVIEDLKRSLQDLWPTFLWSNFVLVFIYDISYLFRIMQRMRTENQELLYQIFKQNFIPK